MVPPWVTVAAECMWAARVHRSVEFGASGELNWTRVWHGMLAACVKKPEISLGRSAS